MESGVAQEPVNLTATANNWSAAWARPTKSARHDDPQGAGKPKQVVFPEGDNDKILRAAHILLDEKIAFRYCWETSNTIREPRYWG